MLPSFNRCLMSTEQSRLFYEIDTNLSRFMLSSCLPRNRLFEDSCSAPQRFYTGRFQLSLQRKGGNTGGSDPALDEPAVSKPPGCMGDAACSGHNQPRHPSI